MKKILLFSLLCLLCTVNSFAGSKPVFVKSGNASVLKIQTKALLEVDYSATKVGSETLDEYLKRRGDDFVRDWPQDREQAISHFIRLFDRHNKGMKLTTDATVASYKIVIHVDSLDMGNVAGAITGMVNLYTSKIGGCAMSGSIDIIDIKTNEVLCIINIDKLKSISEFSETLRLGYMYQDLAVYICKKLKIK